MLSNYLLSILSGFLCPLLSLSYFMLGSPYVCVEGFVSFGSCSLWSLYLPGVGLDSVISGLVPTWVMLSESTSHFPSSLASTPSLSCLPGIFHHTNLIPFSVSVSPTGASQAGFLALSSDVQYSFTLPSVMICAVALCFPGIPRATAPVL